MQVLYSDCIITSMTSETWYASNTE